MVKKVIKKAKSSAASKKASPQISKKSKAVGSEKKVKSSKPDAKKRLVKKSPESGLTTPTMGFEEMLARVSGGQTNENCIEESKFNIGVAHNAQAMPLYEMPPEYGRDRATLLIVDPKFVFTYWEIRQDSINNATNKLGLDAKLTLRFYDITHTGNPENSNSWDVEVFDRLGNWYLKLEHPEQRLCLDIGMKDASGRFIHLARSNIMKLPSQTLARPGPIKWMIVTPSGDKLLSDVEDYTEADLALLKKILGPYFFDLLMRGRFASIAGSSIEAIFYEVQSLRAGESPTSGPPWAVS